MRNLQQAIRLGVGNLGVSGFKSYGSRHWGVGFGVYG